MLENNLIKAYMKATKHAAVKKDGNPISLAIRMKDSRTPAQELEDSMKVAKIN